MLVESDQVRSPVTHRYPTRQQKHQTPSPRVPKQTVRPPRVAPNDAPMETQEKGNLEDLQGWIQVNFLW